MDTTNAISKSRLVEDLKRIGILNGDMVYVHSSMKSVGWIDGGIPTLIEAFLEVLGQEGTLAVPTHTLSFPGRGVPPYDPQTTQSLLGAFTEAVRQYPEALRSTHASHSSAAIGKNAAFLTKNHDLTHALGYDSPVHRLYRSGGRILLIGVNQKVNTSLHLAESLSGVPYTKLHYDASWGADTASQNADGTVKIMTQREFPGCSGNFSKMDGFLRHMRVIRGGKIGNAASLLMDAKPVVDKAIEIIKDAPSFFLCESPRCPCCPPRKELLTSMGYDVL